MTKIGKLYAGVLRNPGGTLDFREFERLIVATGFVMMRIRGSHRAYRHPDVDQLLVIQPRGKEAKPYQVREFLDMIEAYKLTVED